MVQDPKARENYLGTQQNQMQNLSVETLLSAPSRV